MFITDFFAFSAVFVSLLNIIYLFIMFYQYWWIKYEKNIISRYYILWYLHSTSLLPVQTAQLNTDWRSNPGSASIRYRPRWQYSSGARSCLIRSIPTLPKQNIVELAAVSRRRQLHRRDFGLVPPELLDVIIMEKENEGRTYGRTGWCLIGDAEIARKTAAAAAAPPPASRIHPTNGSSSVLLMSSATYVHYVGAGHATVQAPNQTSARETPWYLLVVSRSGLSGYGIRIAAAVTTSEAASEFEIKRR